jgi:hypothetical protein
MKIALLIATLLAAFASPAVAQTSTCQSIQDTADRLACYDKANPPIAAPKQPTKASKTGPKTQPDQATAVDLLAAENSKLDKRLKTICRGC